MIGRREMLLGAAGAATLLRPTEERSAMAAEEMITRPIPSSGEAMPVIGLGTWQAFDVGNNAAAHMPLKEVLTRFTGAGARLIDTSPMYGGAETVVGDRVAETKLLPVAAARRVATIVNQPFETGDMFRRVRGKPVPEWAAEFDCTSWAQLFLKYILAEPAVTAVIPATADPAHMADDLKAGFGRLPDAQQRQKIRQLWDSL